MSELNRKLTRSGLLKHLGPGLIFAGTCIGVSHLVQSTRAGANFGFGLLWAVIAANVIKFPFFEFAPRYVAATGEHLLQGYRRLGKWAFYLFFILSLLTMFPIQSGVTIVCTGLFVNLFNWTLPPVIMSVIILAVCCTILLLGKYPLLDKLMKVMVIGLGISTFLAFIVAATKGSQAIPAFSKQFAWDAAGISFIVALVGWMPTTFEIGVWHSFWSAEKIKHSNYKPCMSESLMDFHIGYWGTMIMAIFFVGLGALVMYGTGETFANSSAKFTGQILNLYTKALGSWSYLLIAAAAATTMFSTTISCLDAFPRVMREALIMINPELKGKEQSIYTVALIIVSVGASIIIGFFVQNMKALIDFATTLAFVAAPIFAFLNLKTVTSSHVPQEYQPSKALQIYSWIGLIFLAAFALAFIWWRFLRG